MKKYESLRKEYLEFIYEKYTYELTDKELNIVYYFNIPGLAEFNPTFKIERKNNFEVNIDNLEKMIFSLGMVELISYWKVVCPKNVIVRAGYLDDIEITWWKKLYLNGLGEFFYVNDITPTNEFMTIKIEADKKELNDIKINSNNVLVPIGGGKDSIVTLEALINKKDIVGYIINPRKTTLDTTNIADLKDVICSYRTIDQNLIKLNSEGYLNGHTPFSAIVAFSSIIAAYINNIKDIALSNESSANESTVKGLLVNHQYSKSLEFENDFRYYNEEYLKNNINYFSFLRPLAEMQIAKMFSKHTKYHSVFKSCNIGSKTDSWCSACAKCLFVYIILAPYLNEKEMINIFGKNMLDDKSLSIDLEKLMGLTLEKPFECVGLIDEVYESLKLLLKNNSKAYLLQKYEKEINNYEVKIDFSDYFDYDNNLTSEYKNILEELV